MKFAPTDTISTYTMNVVLAVATNATKRDRHYRSSGGQFDEHDDSGDDDGQTEDDKQSAHVPDGHSDAVGFSERPVPKLPRQPFLLQVIHHAVGE